MKIEDAIYSYLSSQSSLTDHVSTDIYPADLVPQDRSGPYIAHYISYREKIYTHSGFCGVSIYTIQFSTFAKTKDLAAIIAAVLASALEAWRAVSIGYVMQEDESEGWDEAHERYFYDQSFSVFYRE